MPRQSEIQAIQSKTTTPAPYHDTPTIRSYFDPVLERRLLPARFNAASESERNMISVATTDTHNGACDGRARNQCSCRALRTLKLVRGLRDHNTAPRTNTRETQALKKPLKIARFLDAVCMHHALLITINDVSIVSILKIAGEWASHG